MLEGIGKDIKKIVDNSVKKTEYDEIKKIFEKLKKDFEKLKEDFEKSKK
jgi:hypothetical protein